MALPKSFTAAGYVNADQVRKRRRLMIGTEGITNSGKTEFMLSAPGPGLVICLDRGFDPVLDNPQPPKWRRDDFGFKVVTVPKVGTATQPEFLAYWKTFYNEFKDGLNNLDALTLCLDGDSDSWELQQLAEFGKLTQIPQLMRVAVNAARRAMISRAWDSGKIVIASNKVRDKWIDKVDEDGNPELDDKGKVKRVNSGEKERQGFSDQDYLWHVQIRHLYERKTEKVIPAGPRKGQKISTPPRWGLRILKCKANPRLEGDELWDDQCNFASLVKYIYPNVPLSEWGYESDTWPI